MYAMQYTFYLLIIAKQSVEVIILPNCI